MIFYVMIVSDSVKRVKRLARFGRATSEVSRPNARSQYGKELFFKAQHNPEAEVRVLSSLRATIVVLGLRALPVVLC